MPRPAVAALALAGVFAVGDWVARARRQRVLEYVCKPATTAGLLALAAVLDPAAGLGTRRAWFVAALAFSAVGDVALMVPGDRFVAGLLAFLLAHLCYVVGFFLPGPRPWALAAAGAVVVVLVLPVAGRILHALDTHQRLRTPVAVYMAVITVMTATALASGSPWAGAGAVLFAASDGMIAWDRFVRPFRAAPVAVMVSYHLAQAGLVLSLLH
jgi:uncharacterized membrane protein YhhN